MARYDVFVSYRRDGGDAAAALITQRLSEKGYKVFFDLESMRSGDFNNQIYDAIDMCTDMLVILPEGALERCKDENDWVRLEVAHAIKNNKNIIPVLLRDFTWPIDLPEDIVMLKRFQGVGASMEHFDSTLSRIENLLLCKKVQKPATVKEEKNHAIKVPAFLPTKLRKEDTEHCGYDWGASYYRSLICDRFWWDLLTSGNLPEDEDSLSKIFAEAIEKRREQIQGLYSDAYSPWFIRFGRPKSKGEPPRFSYNQYICFKRDFDLIKNLSNVPKRYKDDSVDPYDLVMEISALSEEVLYDESFEGAGDCIAELFWQGEFLLQRFVRKNCVSGSYLISYCLQCFPDYMELAGMLHFKYGFDHHGRDLFKCVSLFIGNSAENYGTYENDYETINKKVKLFLKYFQLLSFYFLPPPWERWGTKLKKYMLINYKYLRQKKVILSKENEELFTKLVSIFGKLK